MNAITQDEIKSVLSYDAETGILTWKERSLCMFNNQRDWRIWNTRYAGQPVGCVSKGYRYLRVNGERYLAHRVIWLLVYGRFPKMVDHIDQNPSNNRLSNLREVDHIINGRNTKIPKDNTSGTMGVKFNKKRGRWEAKIRDLHLTDIWLGEFLSKDAAVAARKAAEIAHGYHPNHGRRA